MHLAQPSDDRPLKILGARTVPLTSIDNFSRGALWPSVIIASPSVYRQNITVRDYFTRALLQGHAATAMLGDDWPTGLGTDIRHFRHEPSPAARAFKLQAMLAAKVDPAPADSVEMLRGSSRAFTSHRCAFTHA